MKKNKRIQYNSVSDMVQSLSEDRAFAEDFEKRVAKRSISIAQATARAA